MRCIETATQVIEAGVDMIKSNMRCIETVPGNSELAAGEG